MSWLHCIRVLAAKRTDSDTVKTTVELPGELWRAAKIRAMDERADLRTVLIRALEDYLRDINPNARAQYAEPMTETTEHQADGPSERTRPALPPKATLAGRGRRLLRHALVFITVVIVIDAIAGEKGLLALLQARREYSALERSLERARTENSDAARNGAAAARRSLCHRRTGAPRARTDQAGRIALHRQGHFPASNRDDRAGCAVRCCGSARFRDPARIPDPLIR